jgi:hypothetical protein
MRNYAGNLLGRQHLPHETVPGRQSPLPLPAQCDYLPLLWQSTQAGSAAARGCVKTPNSPIAFPLEARIARLQSTLAPLPCQSAQALRDRSPPARLFTQSGELLGGASAVSKLWFGSAKASALMGKT